MTELNNSSAREILLNSNNYKKLNSISSDLFVGNQLFDLENDTFDHNSLNISSVTSMIEINIIESNDNENTFFNEILFSINNYLIKNRTSASDFNLIKDMVERKIDSIEEEINSSIGIPLYLGLMGTMLGIIIGLFNMPELGSLVDTKTMDFKLNEGIGLLIGGVKIAMIASFFGLFFTIINSGWVFKDSRSLVEAKKNDFFTFIQIELLPLINQGLASTLESLQRNLIKFNNEFTVNLTGLSGIFESSRFAIKEQKELLDALDKAKVSEMTRYNVAVLKQLDISVGHFEKFNSNFSNINQFVENSKLIVDKSNELLARTDNFKSIAVNLENRLRESQHLLDFLTLHFNKLEEHKEFTNSAVADIGFSISETFKELKGHIQNSSEAIKQFTVDETELLKSTLSQSKTNLVNLEHLATLKTDLSQFKLSSASQSERIKNALDDLNKNFVRSIEVLEKIEKRNFNHRVKNISQSIKNLFK